MRYVKYTGPMVLALSIVAGCDGKFSAGLRPSTEAATGVPADQSENGTRPMARPGELQTEAPKPVQSARTVEQFDTTTTEQRTAAVTAGQTGTSGEKLGSTIASLGDPTEPGIWIKTPLVSKRQLGRVEYPVSGKSVAVELIPIDGPKTGGSRVSLAALRLLEAPLAGLPELTIYRR